MEQPTEYKLDPLDHIPFIVLDCVDGYATVEQAIEAIRRILTECKTGK